VQFSLFHQKAKLFDSITKINLQIYFCCFIHSIGNPDAIEFYRKWCCPFINESIYNCFNSKSKFHIMYEDIQIITSIKTNNKDFIQKKESFNKKNIYIFFIK